METTAGSVNSENEEANEEPGKVTEDDEDKVDEPNTSESSAGSEGEFYSGQSEKDDDNEEAAILGSNPEIEQEVEPESEPEIEPEVESETEAEAEGVSEENLLKLLADQVKSPTVRDIKNTEDSKSKTVVDPPKRVTRKASLLRKLTGPRRKEDDPPTAPEATDRDQEGGAKSEPPVRRSLRWKDRKQPNWDA